MPSSSQKFGSYEILRCLGCFNLSISEESLEWKLSLSVVTNDRGDRKKPEIASSPPKGPAYREK